MDKDEKIDIALLAIGLGSVAIILGVMIPHSYSEQQTCITIPHNLTYADADFIIQHNEPHCVAWVTPSPSKDVPNYQIWNH